ncbi:Y-family DNA polymerase [Roseibium aestuarii]|uniref:DNA-directed DNA polymerase n=1 Tax=Roseibium aestuarii TaxID=2600299 RepID=A0ABW4K099_9HYPH|nr:DNA polymerase Y family protein [Roseibium aestuarii]
MWFPRLASDRVLRARPTDVPFALTLQTGSVNRIHCLNARAERLGLYRGMAWADARAFCPDLTSEEADLSAEARFLAGLRRWALRYCPWVGLEEPDGLVLDITGSAHLHSGEDGMLADMRQRLMRAGLSVRLGLADTRGAAWALARHGEGIAPAGKPLEALAPLPVAALRLEPETITSLQRLGLRTICDLEGTARAPLARRFGPQVLRRLDQALGRQPEQISPLSDPPHYGVRITLPEPVGLVDDVMALTGRLLDQLCDKLARYGEGARVLHLTLHRVDQAAHQIELRLARPVTEARRILPLFERSVSKVDAGFGIERLRLEATAVERVEAEQLGHGAGPAPSGLEDLLTRIGTRIGIENILRFEPVDTHIPERSFLLAPACSPVPGRVPPASHLTWTTLRPRPLRLFPPEPIDGAGSRPPERFRWRRMSFSVGHATGPERIAPEWWTEDETWQSGLRDYWRVSTRQGRRLWLFHTPQKPGWFVQGEFP